MTGVQTCALPISYLYNIVFVFLSFIDVAISYLPIVIDWIGKLVAGFGTLNAEQISKIGEVILGLLTLGPALTALGGAIPILIAIGTVMASGIKANGPEIIDFFKKVVKELPTFVEKLKEIGTVVGPHLQKLFDAFMNMKPETIVTIMEVIGGLAILGPILLTLGGAITFLVSIGTLIGSIASGIGAFVSAFWAVSVAIGTFIAGSILLPLLVIIGTLALLYYAWKTNFGGIQTTINQLGVLLRIGLAQMFNDFIAKWTAIGIFLLTKVVEMKINAEKMVAGIKAAFNINWSELGKKIIDGLIAGLKNGMAAVTSAAASVADAALKAAKKVLGVKSPSTAFAEIGNFSGMGFMQGLQRSMQPQMVGGIMNRVIVGAAQTMNRSITNNVTVNNPSAEPASRSVDSTLRKMSYLGIVK